DIQIPSTLESIGKHAFDGCKAITKVKNLENSQLKEIEEYTFNDCEALEAISFPNMLEEIGDYAFQTCSSLTEIHIPGSVNSIGTSAFRNCSSLETVYEDRSLDDLEKNGAAEAKGSSFGGVPTNCFLVVPEDGARFYTNNNEYGATVPTKAYWNSISNGVSSEIPFMREKTVTIDITTAEGYVTHYSPYSYTLPDDWKYGIITGADDDTGELSITWKNTNKVVPAGSSVLIKRESGDESYPCETFNNNYETDAETVSTSNSKMHGTVDLETTDNTNVDGVETGYKFYKLSYIKNEYGVKELGFFWGAEDGGAFPIIPTTETTYEKGVKLAWLALESNSSSPVKAFYPLDANATGIESIEVNDSESATENGTGKDVIYNLQGMKVNEITHKGIYIVNGKKVVKQ
ncbi:MAG: leucine-rich repeat domain-containing protein, partial [Prevotella sp.]|nr:leucine-rich repeat domain-containing protein [Prevotella sp.]